MKALFVVSALLISTSAQANVLMIQNNEVYLIDQKDPSYSTSPIKKRIKESSAIKFVNNGNPNGYITYDVKGVEKWPDVEMLNKPVKPKISKPEGCGKNPRFWLYKAEVVGKLKKSNDQAIYLEIPIGFKSDTSTPPDFKKALQQHLIGGNPFLSGDDSGKSAIESCSKNTIFLKKENTIWSVSSCGLELNEDIMVLEKSSKEWIKKASYTVTEECP